MTAAPCVRCARTGGDFSANSHRPCRIDTSRFGWPGASCRSCYVLLRYYHKLGRKDPELATRGG